MQVKIKKIGPNKCELKEKLLIELEILSDKNVEIEYNNVFLFDFTYNKVIGFEKKENFKISKGMNDLKIENEMIMKDNSIIYNCSLLKLDILCEKEIIFTKTIMVQIYKEKDLFFRNIIL